MTEAISAKPASRIPSLDGLRAIAILLVVLGHAANTPGFPNLGLITAYADFGVRVFFVISGFLITTLLIEERRATGSISIGNFYRRRAYRILPAVYLFLAIVLAVTWKAIPRYEIFTALTFTENFIEKLTWVVGHLWSLSVEEQFYLLWPFLIYYFWNRRIQFLLVAIASAPFFRIGMYFIDHKSLSNTVFFCVQDSLAIGCLLALCRHRIDTAKVDTWIIPILIATLAMKQFRYPHGVYPFFIPSLMNIGIALLIDHCIRKKYRILNIRPIVWIGSISYSLYLWQQPFNNVQWHSVWTTFPLNILAIIACSCASYYLVERSALRLRDRLHGVDRTPPRAQISAELPS